MYHKLDILFISEKYVYLKIHRNKYYNVYDLRKKEIMVTCGIMVVKNG
jgi:hypothetical protein